MIWKMIWKLLSWGPVRKIYNWDPAAMWWCLRNCLLPLATGLLLWAWLPDTLIAWQTNQGAFSGTQNRLMAVLGAPLLYTAAEFIFIATVDHWRRRKLAATPLPLIFALVALFFSGMNLYPLLRTAAGGAVLGVSFVLFVVNCLLLGYERKEK